MSVPAIGAISSLGSEWGISSIGGLGSAGQVAPVSGDSGSGSGSFASALTNAVDGLQQTQTSADTAAQGLATGQVTDPTQAITTVENAQIAMELASQISNKAVSDVQTIFQTTM